jgi:SH3-like domain-containing protein
MKNIFKTSIIILVAVLSCQVMQASTAEDIINNLKTRIAPDARTAIWDVKTISQNGVPTIYGTVGLQEQKDAVDKELRANGINDFQDNLIVLENSVDKHWAMVKLSIATLRVSGEHEAEAATQAIMGTPLRVIQEDDDWYRVQTPDNYIAYIPGSSIIFKDNNQIEAWKKAKRYIVTVYDSRLVTEPKGDETVSDLVLGNILEFKAKKGKWLLLSTPDGREGYVESKDVEEFGEWSKQKLDTKVVEKTARRMMGSGYLWGGTSTKVTDCSGLAKVSYFSNGIILQRDASQQARYGMKIKPEDWQQAKLGDLVFFGNEAGHVVHVGIYLSNGQYIHCSGRVKINSVDPNASDYLTTKFVSISRIDGQVGTAGITAVCNHPWYF